jgi:hypothetical protein
LPSLNFDPAGTAASAISTHVGQSDPHTQYAPKSSVRERLTADRTYYVRTDGSNSNDGFTDSAGGAFLTIQKAIDVVSDTLDLGIYSVTIQVGAGTYGAIGLKQYIGAGIVNLRGNTTTPSDVTITGPTSIHAEFCGRWDIRGFKTGGSSRGLYAIGNTAYIIFGNMDFGACSAQQVESIRGAVCFAAANITISGGSSVGFWAGRQGYIWFSTRTITFSGSVTYPADCFRVTEQGFIDLYSVTFVGSFTGKRYSADGLSGIFVNGAGSTYIPGSVSGTTSNGGVYY